MSDSEDRRPIAIEPDDWYLESDPHHTWIWVCTVKARRPRKQRCRKRRPPTEAEACAIQRRLRDASPFPQFWCLPGFCRHYRQGSERDAAG